METGLGRTIRILASRSLVASGATLVCARLSVFGLIGKIVRRVGRSVRLGVNSGKSDQSDKAKTED